MDNPWDAGPPDSHRTRVIGWVLALGATVLLAIYLTAADRQDGPAPTPTSTVSR